MRLDVVQQPPDLFLVEGERDLVTTRRAQQALEVLRLPSERDPLSLGFVALGGDPFHVEQEVDRTLVGAQDFLHLVPRDHGDEAAYLGVRPWLNEADGSASLVHVASSIYRAARDTTLTTTRRTAVS